MIYSSIPICCIFVFIRLPLPDTLPDSVECNITVLSLRHANCHFQQICIRIAVGYLLFNCLMHQGN